MPTSERLPSSGGDYDIATVGFTLQLDSGDGNAFAYSGSISGTGAVEFYMVPSNTSFRDAPKLTSLQGAFLVVCDDDRNERWAPVGTRMVVANDSPPRSPRTAHPSAESPTSQTEARHRDSCDSGPLFPTNTAGRGVGAARYGCRRQ